MMPPDWSFRIPFGIKRPRQLQKGSHTAYAICSLNMHHVKRTWLRYMIYIYYRSIGQTAGLGLSADGHIFLRSKSAKKKLLRSMRLASNWRKQAMPCKRLRMPGPWKALHLREILTVIGLRSSNVVAMMKKPLHISFKPCAFIGWTKYTGLFRRKSL